ncbi:MAG TPA: ATP-dependent Clp protease ATP-binding subunit, partial [bacterium]|nr:ATP-dependent Clp protease ATP-binding subunit [bacterium]
RKLRSLINTLVLLFGVTGGGFLFYFIYELDKMGWWWRTFFYARNEYTFIFWVALWADFYLVYRINRESKSRFSLKNKSFWRRLAGESSENQNFDWSLLEKARKKEIFGSFDPRSRAATEEAWLLAEKLAHPNWENIHLLASFLANTQANLVFARLSVDYQKLIEKIKHGLNKIMGEGKRVITSGEVRTTMLLAFYSACTKKKKQVGATDILWAITKQEGLAREILYDLEISDVEIEHAVAWVDLQSYLIKRWHQFRYLSRLKPKNAMNRAYTAVATPHLDSISRDMTLWARAGAYAPCIGRESEMAEIFRIMEVDKTGALLVGYQGVGKGSILEGIAELMVQEEVPDVLKDKRLVSLSVSGLIAGAGQFGGMEANVLSVMREIGKARNIVLVVEDIHHLVGVATGGDSMDLAEVFAEQMQAYNFLVIATTTPEAFKNKIENSSLPKVMQKVPVNEPSKDEVIRILEARALQLEAEQGVYFSYQSLEAAAKMAGRYLHDEYLPAKAIKLLEEATLMAKNKRGIKTVVGADDVATIIAELTNIPVTKVTMEESKKLLTLEQEMQERIVGQNEALAMIGGALRRARTELRGKNRPIASFLFLGPTGVGKTQVTKTLAEIYFGSEKNMVRLDMSEYQASDALARMIGDTVTGKGGYLTDRIRKRPFSLVLLDEIEKADAEILDLILQVLDDGRLTDAHGKTVDFSNTIIIGTSNAGTEFIQESIRGGKDMTATKEMLIESYLKKYFRPEFINRFDGIVVFSPLSPDDVAEIARIFLNQLAERLEEKGIGFGFEEGALIELARLGFDPTMGARPLRRVVQDKIEDALARLLLQGNLERRDKIILRDNLDLDIEKAEQL